MAACPRAHDRAQQLTCPQLRWHSRLSGCAIDVRGGLPIFGKCDVVLSRDVWRDKPTAQFRSGQTIYQKGNTVTYSYKVIEGARISNLLADGHRQILNFCLPNETFEIESDGVYTAFAEAVGPSTILRRSRDCINWLNDKRVETRHEVLAMLSRKISATEEHVVMLGYQSARGRVA